MSCYHPLKAFPTYVSPETGKQQYKICSYNTVAVRWNGNKFIALDGKSGLPQDIITDFIEIPCGKCIGCRLSYSREWANRCMLEASYHKSSYFVTLTYDNEHLHGVNHIDLDTGEFFENAMFTLCKSDLQKFMKRLRFNTGQDIRYYSAGEYGSATYRPHYHLIIFGLYLDDLKIMKTNFRGDLFYTSETIAKAWPFGFHLVSDVSWDTCAYTARYVMKKRKGQDAYLYEKLGIEPEFCTMSLKPGIGKLYYEDNKDHIYTFDSISISSGKSAIKFKPPRYFDRLYDIEYPEKFSVLKERRKLIGDSLNKIRSRLTDLEYLDYLAVAEESKQNKIKALRRCLE